MSDMIFVRPSSGKAYMKRGLQLVLLLQATSSIIYSFAFYSRPLLISPSRTALSGVVSKKWRGDDQSTIGDERVGEFADTQSEGFETEPEWLDLFPPRGRDTKPEIVRDYPDFASLAPDDPLFIDMPWPSEAGPEASAFGRHMQWRRGLTDGERRRWQQYAIYQRLMKKHHFGYALEDFVFQNMIRDIYQRADKAKAKSQLIEESMWRALALKHKDEQETEVKAVMKSLYSAFNRKNYDELRTLWLPDESVEMVLPGHEKARGSNEVQKLYRQIIKNSRPFGSVDAKVVSVNSNGFVAVVQTVEIVGPGTELKVLKKKTAGPAPVTKPSPPKRVLATTVLRKWNQQWRVMVHHAVRFTSSPFTGDQLTLSMPKVSKRNQMLSSSTAVVTSKDRGKAEIEERIAREMARLGLPPMTAADLDALLKGGGGSISTMGRLNKDGVWEKVVTVDDETRDVFNWAKQLQST